MPLTLIGKKTSCGSLWVWGPSQRVGMEESLRFFIFDGVRKQAPKMEYVSAQPALKSAGVDTSSPTGRGGRKQ